MRQRTTFIHKSGDSVDPARLKVAGRTITGPEIKAAREDRLTLALDELPSELQLVLKNTHELHIRWVSSRPYESVSPLWSRLSPGLHVFYTPQAEDSTNALGLCSTLGKAFGTIHCTSPEENFTRLQHDRFTHSTAFQYFQPMNNLSEFAKYVRDTLCPVADNLCADQVDRIAEAVSLDVSYDTIAHALRITMLGTYQAQAVQVSSRAPHRAEVGILAEDKPPNLEPFEVGVSGLLTVLGDDSAPKPALFSFPSRHKHSGASFAARFLHPTGLHPTLQIMLDSNKSPSADSHCSPHAYLVLPRSIFPDKYQFGDKLFLASKNLTALRYVSQPVDLEAPEYVMKSWGSTMLLELAPPSAADKVQKWSAEIPLHLRYLSPLEGGYREIEVPYPTVFWACPDEEGTKFPTNPFERVNLGYDGLFGPRTVFWHVDPRPSAGGRLFNTITVPVLSLEDSSWINIGTAITVLLGFAWVAWKLSASMKYGIRRQPTTFKAKKHL